MKLNEFDLNKKFEIYILDNSFLSIDDELKRVLDPRKNWCNYFMPLYFLLKYLTKKKLLMR